MDYRIRWQQRRRQRRQKQLLIIPAALLLVVFVYLISRLFAGGGAKVFWVHEDADNLVPRFAVGPSLVYVAGADGHVTALQQQSGKSVTRGPFFSFPEAYNTTPLLADHTLYVASDLGRLRALDARTGQQQWVFEAQSPIRYAPQMAAGRLIFGTDGGKLYCFSPQGKKLWVKELGAALSGQGAVIDGSLTVCTIRGEVYCLKLADATVLWRKPLAVPVFAPVAAARSLVMIGSDNGHEYILRAGDGALVTRFYTAGLIRTAAAAGEKGLYFGSSDGWLRVVSADGKKPLWARYLGGPVTVGPVVAGELVYVGRAGRLVALRAETGRLRREWEDEQFAGDLVVTKDTVYVGTTTGKVLALAAP
ncbi:MAG: outer membrane protein assembly factor BamB family protein [Armatimonadota bacterium]